MLRRLAAEQPETFAFTPANLAWAEKQISKYPAGREASAVIPLLWRAQEQEGWLTKPAIEYVASMLGMAYIRALEVASFYFMFQLQPVGSVANIQVCGTTTCMICGAEDLIAVCKEKIAKRPHMVSEDGKLSWEEVECLGACANAPMAQIGKDYYEDLTAERFGEIIEELRAGKVPTPGPQNGRFASEPKLGLTSLTAYGEDRQAANGSVALATSIGETVKRIDGTEVPLVAPWGDQGGRAQGAAAMEAPAASPQPPAPTPGEQLGDAPRPGAAATNAPAEQAQPAGLDGPRDGNADDLTRIDGIGPKLGELLNAHGIYHFDQIATWGPEEIAWMDNNLLRFKGRVTRDNWVAQAKALSNQSET